MSEKENSMSSKTSEVTSEVESDSRQEMIDEVRLQLSGTQTGDAPQSRTIEQPSNDVKDHHVSVSRSNSVSHAELTEHSHTGRNSFEKEHVGVSAVSIAEGSYECSLTEVATLSNEHPQDENAFEGSNTHDYRTPIHSRSASKSNRAEGLDNLLSRQQRQHQHATLI